MRKMSNKAKAEGYDALKRERDVLAAYAWHVVNGHVAIREVIDRGTPGYTDDDSTYLYLLYGAFRADGGIIVEVLLHSCQSNYVRSVRYFDDWFAEVKAIPYGIGISTEVHIVADRLQAARSRLYEAKRSA